MCVAVKLPCQALASKQVASCIAWVEDWAVKLCPITVSQRICENVLCHRHLISLVHVWKEREGVLLPEAYDDGLDTVLKISKLGINYSIYVSVVSWFVFARAEVHMVGVGHRM